MAVSSTNTSDSVCRGTSMVISPMRIIIQIKYLVFPENCSGKKEKSANASKMMKDIKILVDRIRKRKFI